NILENYIFFDLIFEQYDPKVSKSYLNNDNNKQRVKDNKIDSGTTVADEFKRFFKTHNLDPLFTDDYRFPAIEVRLPDAESVIKDGGKANKILLEFADWANMATDNKAYQRAMAKILQKSKNWNGFLKQLQETTQYFGTVESNYMHNIWNIVYYDKLKEGTAVSGGRSEERRVGKEDRAGC